MSVRQSDSEGQSNPHFVKRILESHACGQKVQILSGDIRGLFQSGGNYQLLEQTLLTALGNYFTVVAFDMLGISFYDNDSLESVLAVCVPNSSNESGQKQRPSWFATAVETVQPTLTPRDQFLKRLSETKYAPLTAMSFLQDIAKRFATAQKSGEKIKPLCVLVRHAATLFPAKELSQLDQQDRQRLVFFMNWLQEPFFQQGHNMFLLVESSRAEVNNNITLLPFCEHVQIPLPTEAERASFIKYSINGHAVKLEMAVDELATATAGLALVDIKHLLDVARVRDEAVTRQEVVRAVNDALQIMLGDIVTFKPVTHTSADVQGYDGHKQVLTEVFEDCNDPATAVSGVLVSGPNGVGKTYLVEALAAESGRVVIELTGLRNQMFGGTERFFEQFRLVVTTFGRILIEVDEAHTAFGSVHTAQTHEVERRLAGNIIKMMGDPAYLGKILWVLMTSRPDELDPDVKSRCPIQVPIFDLKGEERVQYITQYLTRVKVADVTETEVRDALPKLEDSSNRDINFMIRRFIARRKKTADLTFTQFLDTWQAGSSIKVQRVFQALVATEHSTFPQLVPERLRAEPEERARQIATLKLALGY